MLEKYEKDFDENEFMRSFMERKQISTKKQALAELRKLIKKEGYYQTKIKEALKKRYPDAFVAKISQGAYSQAGSYPCRFPMLPLPVYHRWNRIHTYRCGYGHACCTTICNRPSIADTFR